MRKFFILVLFLLFGSSVNAESEWDSMLSNPFDWESAGLGSFDWESMDLDPFDLEGFTPRYAFMRDDKMIGKMHYVGMSYFRKRGVISDGVTARVGLGDWGTRINLAYTNTFSFFGLDFGLSYTFLDDDNPRAYRNGHIEGLSAELGARMWVVQVIAIQMENYSYVKLAYGF